MAERINFNKVDRNDPRFLEADPTNPNTNISASRFDPTDPTAKGNPIAEAYNKFLQTAEVGDTFDFGAVDPTQKGISTKFVGFNKMGTPIIQTIESPERADWQGAIAGAGPTYAAQLKALTDTGRSETEARFLIAKTSGPEFVAAATAGKRVKFEQIGAMADGTPIYGYGPDGKPVTSPTGNIFSTTSPSDAIAKANAGSKPLSGTATGTGGAITQADVDAAVAKAVAAATAKTDALVAQQKAEAAAAKFATKVRASDRLKAMFDGVGLGTLAPFIDKRIMEDASEESVLLELYDQPEYQARFPGMKALRSKGKTITEAEYIKDEKAFAQTARFFDVPVGFYDTPDDFGKLIGNLVSPKEFQDRLQVGQDLGRSMSPGVKTQLQELYNIGEGGITAYVLDSDKALPLLQKQAKAAQFVGFGRERGFKLEGMTAAQAEQIAGTEAYAKLSAQQMQTSLSQAAQLRQTQSRLTGIEGEIYNEGEALKAVIEGSPEAILASQQRAQREGARFGGGSGVTGSSLRSTTAI